MDNLDPVAGNQDPAGGAGAVGTGGTPPVSNTSGTPFTWKSGLGPDLMNSPTLQKFEDSQDGLVKAVTSHLELEKMLGHEKVPIPKGPDDKEGWNRFSKAMGIPDKATEYGLADATVPDNMKGMTFDKQKFADTVHAFKLTPAQAKGLWESYQTMVKDTYGKAMQDHQAKMTEVVNRMRSEWGDAYDTNVELGQTVINKFADDQDTQDYITAALAKDPRGIKFLAKIGNQFAENKIGDFKNSRFSLSPEQAQTELDTIRRDQNHPYNNEKASAAERDRAIGYVNSLIATIQKAKG